MAVARLRPLITPPTVKHTASMIFLHGSGDTGSGIRDWLMSATPKGFSFPHIRILYPTAPVRSYTPMGGFPTTVWFDRKEISPLFDEDDEGLNDMCNAIRELIDVEVRNGIPRHRIIIGGFSMGAALAMHCAFRFCPDMAGVIALSGFLSQNSTVYKLLSQNHNGSSLPPLYQAHGESDPLVDVEWGRDTNKQLTSFGIRSEFKTFPDVPHTLDTNEIEDVMKWINNILPND